MTQLMTIEQSQTNGSAALMPAPAQTIQRTGLPRSVFEMTQQEFERMKVLANMYAVSSFGKSKLDNGDYFLIMMKGLELGLRPMTAVDFISIIQGVPVVDAKGMLALISDSGQLADIVIDSQPESCTVTMTRKGRSSHTEVFDLAKARAMNLMTRDNYKKQVGTMLKWRAVTACARVVFPDVIGGLYTHEEIDPDNIVVMEDGTMTESTNTSPLLPKPPAQKQQPTIVPKVTDNEILDFSKQHHREAVKTLSEKATDDSGIEDSDIVGHFNVTTYGAIPDENRTLARIKFAISELSKSAKSKTKQTSIVPPKTDDELLEDVRSQNDSILDDEPLSDDELADMGFAPGADSPLTN